jgi:hypothetical protein
MAVRNDFTAGEVLAAADLNDTFGAKLDVSAYLPGKILQVVRATDSTNRTTTSATYTDVTGMSVTITPQFSNSVILILANFYGRSEKTSSTVSFAGFRITDASDNAISGAQDAAIQIGGPSSSWTLDQQVTMIAYATPATENAVTYKLRFRSNGTTSVQNATNTGQMYALEIAA